MKFLKYSLAAVFLTLSSVAMSDGFKDALESGYKYCDSMAEFAATALEFRQSGKPKEFLLVLAQISPDMTRIAELAYEFPLVKGPEESADDYKELSKSQFSESVRLGCRDDALRKAREERSNNNNVTTISAENANSRNTTSSAADNSGASKATSGPAEKLKEMDLANNPNKYQIVSRYKDDLDLLLVRKLETSDQSVGIYAFIYATTMGGWKLADKHVLRGTWWPDTQQFYWSHGGVGTQTGCTFWGPEHWSSTFIHKNMQFGEKTISVWTPTGKYTPGREYTNQKTCRKLEVDMSCSRLIRCHEWHDDDPGRSEFYVLDNGKDALYLYEYFRNQIRR